MTIPDNILPHRPAALTVIILRHRIMPTALALKIRFQALSVTPVYPVLPNMSIAALTVLETILPPVLPAAADITNVSVIVQSFPVLAPAGVLPAKKLILQLLVKGLPTPLHIMNVQMIHAAD